MEHRVKRLAKRQILKMFIQYFPYSQEQSKKYTDTTIILPFFLDIKNFAYI